MLHGGYATGDNNTQIYDNGMALAEYKYYERYILTPADGVTLTAELLGIPGKYPLETDKDTNEVLLPMYENIKDNKSIMSELAAYVKKGLRKGLIAKAETEQTITGKCFSEPRLAIILKDGTDIDEFIADYPEYELTADNSDVPEEYKNYQLFTRVAEEEEVLDISNKGFRDHISCDMVGAEKYGSGKKNSRIKLTNYFGKTCDEVHSISKRVPFDDEYFYVDDPENIAWSDSWVTVYKNGKIYSELRKNTHVEFIPANEYKDIKSLPGLPDKYNIYGSDYLYNNKEPCSIFVQNEEELEEVTAVVKGWAEKGMVKSPQIRRFYTHGCGSVEFYIILKNEDDFDSFAADYPEYTINNVSSEDYPGRAYIVLSKEQVIQYKEIEEALKSDSRVERLEGGIICCCVLHTLPDIPEPIEFNSNESDTVNNPIVTTTYQTTEPPVYTSEVRNPTEPAVKDPAVTTVIYYNTTAPTSSKTTKTETVTTVSTVQNTSDADTSSKPTSVTTKIYYNTTEPASSKTTKIETVTMVSSVQSTSPSDESTTTGTQTIPDKKPVIRGDISGNGKIDIYDAIEIAKSLVTRRVFTEEEMEIADYNGDGKVDLYDAIGIAEYIIKNI